jgi:hypothetical protein
MKNKKRWVNVMKKRELVKNNTLVAVKSKTGVTELYPIVTVKALAMQVYLGLREEPSSKSNSLTIMHN